MWKVYDGDGLNLAVEIIRGKGFWKGLSSTDKVKVFGRYFGKGQDKQDIKADEEDYARYSWMQHHDSIQIGDDILDVKVRTALGNILTRSRYVVDHGFNEGFLLSQRPKKSTAREIHTYQHLNKIGFPTYECMNHKYPYVNDALLTRRVQNAKHGIDIIDAVDDKKKMRYASEVSALLRRLHDTGTIWGDAWLGNTMYADGKLILYDFNLRPDPSKKKTFLEGKDLVSLIMSGVYRSKLPPLSIVPDMIDAYAPSDEVKSSVHGSILSMQRNRRGSKIRDALEENLYLLPVYGMHKEKVDEVYRTISKSIKG